MYFILIFFIFLQPNVNMTMIAHTTRHARTRPASTHAVTDLFSAAIMQSVTPKIIVPTAHAQPERKETHLLLASLAFASITRTVAMMRLATGSTESADQFAMKMTVLLTLSVKANNINQSALVRQVQLVTLTLTVPCWQIYQNVFMTSTVPPNKRASAIIARTHVKLLTFANQNKFAQCSIHFHCALSSANVPATW